MSDPLFDLIYDIDHNGIRVATIIALYALIRKERRNHYLDLRDEALFQNIKLLMEDRGLGQCFVENPNLNKNMEEALLKRGLTVLSPAHIATLFTHRKVTKKSIWRLNMQKVLSKKFLLAIIGAIIPVINVEFGLNLDSTTIIVMISSIIAGIAGIAHVDAKTASAAVTAVKVAVTADPNLTYKDMVKTVNTVHTAITEVLADLQKNDGSAAFHAAADAYTTLLSVVHDFKKPEPLPAIEQKVTA